MKKVFLSFVMAVFAIHLSAQKIVVDKVYSDNSRGIICESQPCRNFSDRVVLSVSLGAVTDQKDLTTYNIMVTFSEIATATDDFSIPDNATLLIRTADESVLELKCQIGETDYFGDIKRVGNTLVNMKTVSSISNITEEQIQHLCSGIIKVRCELNSSQLKQEYYENNFKKAKLSDYFKQAKAQIDSALSEKKSGSITEGF